MDTAAPSLPEITPPPPEAQLSPAELEQRFADAWDGGVPEPRLLRETYLSLMSLGDEHCPGDPEQIVAIVWGCTAASGWTYAGTTEYKESGRSSDHEGWKLLGDATIDGPDGERFVIGGHAYLDHKEDEGVRWDSEIQGTWSYRGAEGWLDPGVSAKFQLNGFRDGETATVTLDGGLGAEDIELVFEALTLDMSCAAGARGDLWLRDTSGGWFLAEFQEDCAQCAALSFEGQPLSEPLCLDFSALTETYTDL